MPAFVPDIPYHI
jgi:hypothetical protein